jgi:predicted nucleic acid-binding protein
LRVFLDTNVIVYATTDNDLRKRQIALELIRGHVGAGTGVISTQVLAEYVSVAVGKARLDASVVARQITYLETLDVVQVTPTLIRRGLELKQLYGVNFWDGCILAAAEQARCGVILSEDLNPGQSYAGVRVENPFA